MAAWRRTLAVNVAVQGFGALASFGVVAVLARVAGPQTQGEFAVFRSLIDFLVVLMTFGLPSGFVYVVGKDLVAPHVLARWSARAIPLFLIVSGAAVLGYLWTRPDAHDNDLGSTVLLLTLATTASAFYALMRAVVLTCTDGAAFAWLTALPPILLFVLAVGGASSGAWTLPAAFAVTWLAAATASFALWWTHRRRRPVVATVPGMSRVLRKQSVHSFVQGLCLSGAVFGTILAIQVLGGAVHDVGQFSVASLAVVGPNLFVAMIAPLLFNRWARSMTSTGRQRLVRQAVVAALALQLLVLPVLPFSVDVLTAVFSDDYRDGAVAMTPLLLALFPLVVTRVVAPALQATGDTSIVSVSWGIRLAAPWVLLPAATWVDDVVLWATLATACGEYAAMGAMLLMARRRSRLTPA